MEQRDKINKGSAIYHFQQMGVPYTVAKSNGMPTIDIQSVWKQILITKEPPEETSLIDIDGVPVVTAENHSLIVGKKKARKTLFIVWLLAQYEGNIESDVLLFDTEQSKRHVYQIRKRLFKLTKKKVPVFYLRGRSPQERKQIILETVKHWHTKPKLIVIDGVRDLVSNINDPDQATDLVVWLETLTANFGLHVVNVLHLNKTDNNARGHIGTELSNKAEITFEVERNEQEVCSVVKCESSRDEPFEPFAFTHDLHGLPKIVDIPFKGDGKAQTQKAAFQVILANGKTLKYQVLVDELIKRSYCNTAITAKRWIDIAKTREEIFKAGNKYKLTDE